MSKRRFAAQESTVTKELVNLMKKMGANNLSINKDLLGDSAKVEIIFDRNGRRYCYSIDKWSDSLDNYRAAQLTITYLYRAYEVYGAFDEDTKEEAFNRFFLGLEATPDDDVLKIEEKNTWWDVLGVKRNSTKKEVQNAFRTLSKFYHPDAGGDKEMFSKLNFFYREALAEVGG